MTVSVTVTQTFMPTVTQMVILTVTQIHAATQTAMLTVMLIVTLLSC